MEHEEGTFDSAQGEAIYYQSWHPATAAKATLLVVHGMGEHGGRYAPLARHLTAQGYVACALDLPGHGKSGGRPGFINRFEDYTAVVGQYLALVREHYPNQTLFLLGHSMGGLISATFLLQNQAAFQGAILSGPAVISPLKPPALQMALIKLLSILLPKLGVLQLDPSAVSRDPAVVRQYIEDPLNYTGKISARSVAELFGAMERLRERAASLQIPLLLLHGEADSLTAVAGSRFLHEAASSRDKTLRLYPGLYHEVLNEPEHQQIFAEISDWLDAHLSPRKQSVTPD